MMDEVAWIGLLPSPPLVPQWDALLTLLPVMMDEVAWIGLLPSPPLVPQWDALLTYFP